MDESSGVYDDFNSDFKTQLSELKKLENENKAEKQIIESLLEKQANDRELNDLNLEFERELQSLENKAFTVIHREELTKIVDSILFDFNLDPAPILRSFNTLNSVNSFTLTCCSELLDASLCFEFSTMLLNQLEILECLSRMSNKQYKNVISDSLFNNLTSSSSPARVLKEYFRHNIYVTRNTATGMAKTSLESEIAASIHFSASEV